MKLSNHEFDELMKDYAQSRRQAERDAFERSEALNEAYPELKEIAESIRHNTINRAKASILKRADEMAALEREAESLKEKRAVILAENRIDEALFRPNYRCPLCHDTGFVSGQKCACFLEKERAILRESSHLGSLLETDTFANLTTAYYDDTEKDGRPSERARMTEVIERAKAYAANFDRDGGSLLFIGQSGVGKSFLSNCIAEALLSTGHSVVYYSSITLFELLSKLLRERDGESQDALTDELLESDLLIIDDLGTELLNAYTNSKFFQIVNERILRHKSTVISTNMSPVSLRERYSERVASRILASYEAVQLDCSDIRIKKKFS